MLEGKVVLVTGAASGIGRAAAELFAELGATVVAADRESVDGVEAEAPLATQSRHAATTVVAMPAAWRRRSGMDIGMGGILRSRAVLPSDVRHEPGISAGAGAGVEHQA